MNIYFFTMKSDDWWQGRLTDFFKCVLMCVPIIFGAVSIQAEPIPANVSKGVES